MNQTHEEKVQEHYKNFGGWYRTWNPDHIHFGVFEPGEFPAPDVKPTDSPGFIRGLNRIIDVIVDPAEIEAHHHVVDAGCGVGGTAVTLAQTRGCRVTGVNLSTIQLEAARQRALDEGESDRVRFEYANCSEHLPFADESIDVVVNIESACHYRDRGQFLREVSRILKPGGKIVAMDWIVPDDLTADLYEEYIRPICEAWALVSLESQASYTDLLHAAGLQIMEFEGFHGREMDNLRMFQRHYRLLKGVSIFGGGPPQILEFMKKIHAICASWEKGHFGIKRYYAVKPPKT